MSAEKVVYGASLVISNPEDAARKLNDYDAKEREVERLRAQRDRLAQMLDECARKIWSDAYYDWMERGSGEEDASMRANGSRIYIKTKALLAEIKKEK